MKKIVDMHWLRQSWYLLFNRQPEQVDETLEQILKGILIRYSEPHRYYHTLAHVEEMLRLLENYRGIAHNYFHLAFAIWFHDIIWDPKSKSKEEQSAFFACEALKIIISKTGTSQIIDKGDMETAIRYNCDIIKALILATKYTNPQEDQDCQLICDLDLYRFSGDMATQDTQDIRQEHAYASDEEFVRGREKFLLNMATRGYIFQTQTFRALFEEKATDNIRKQADIFLKKVQAYDKQKNKPKFLSFFS